MDFNTFKTDSKKEESGVWVKCGDGEVLISSSASAFYKKVQQRTYAPHAAIIQLGALKDEMAQQLYIETVAEGIIRDWRGFTEDGNECPYTVENAIRLLTEAPRFRAFVEEHAGRIENFKNTLENSAAKNSPTV